jgi:hypothetical protein
LERGQFAIQLTIDLECCRLVPKIKIEPESKVVGHKVERLIVIINMKYFGGDLRSFFYLISFAIVEQGGLLSHLQSKEVSLI